MTVTTQYGANFIQTIDLTNAQSDASVIGLANGGLAGLGFSGAGADPNDWLVHGTILNASSFQTGSFSLTESTFGDITQLANGNLVIAYIHRNQQDLFDYDFKIINGINGNVIVDTMHFYENSGPTTSVNGRDMIALTGGRFVFSVSGTTVDSGGGVNFDRMVINIRNADGSIVTQIIYDPTDFVGKLSLAALDNGNFAIVWNQAPSGGPTQTWFAVYDANGATVRAPTLHDGNSVNNSTPTITATDGGFAIAHADNVGGTGVGDIMLTMFDSAGIVLGNMNASSSGPFDPTSSEFEPAIVRLANGMLAIGWTRNQSGEPDTVIGIFNAAGTTRLHAFDFLGGELASDNVEDVALAALADGRLAVFHTNTTDSDVDGEIFNIVRTSTSDGAGDTIDGDELQDNMNGFGGNDVLNGAGGNDVLSGGDGDDILNGGSGNDTMNGGAGLNQMRGGTGNDTYLTANQADLIFEEAGQGIDTVNSTVSFYLYQNIENLTLTANDNQNPFGVGNALANTITGNGGDNLLIAGAGDDTVVGGGGNDLLFGEDGADTLNGDAGIDYLAAGIGNDFVYGGDDADNLYGEDGDDLLDGGNSFHTDILTGGAGNDVLDGISGQSNPDYDLMDGGSGDDIYWVDTGDDLTFEGLVGGTDTVHANVTVANAGVYLYANVENLVLEGATAFGVGNELNNQLTGSASGNWLLGGLGTDRIAGMAGNDVLFGEGGADTFVFGADSGADVIGDFSVASDRIEFSSYFTSFAQAQAAFVQVGNDGAINLGGGNLIVLHGVTMASLTAANFTFVSPAEPPAARSAVPVMEPLAFQFAPDDSFADHGLLRWQAEFGQAIMP